jgi:hypothetical protein
MMRIYAIIYLAVLMPVAAWAGFAEEAQFGAGNTAAVAWGDIDNDANLDLAAGNDEQQSYLYVSDGVGGFIEKAQFDSGNTLAVSWGDCDNDGDLDLAVGNWDQENFFYANDGNGGFVGETRFGTNKTSSLAWGDADNDGDLDLAVGNWGEQNYLYVNDGAGGFNEETRFGIGKTVTIAWGDYDNDGDLDLAVGNYSEKNYLYVNDGTGNFTEEPQFGTGATNAIAWGDYDNDGDLDLVAGNYGQQNYLYVNDGAGGFAEEAQFGANNTFTVTWGDYDNDGDLDLAVGNGSQNYLYTNDGAGGFTEAAGFGTKTTITMAGGDFDNDGDLDMAVGNWGQQNYLYVNDENDGDYLSVHPIGRFHSEGASYSGRDGIGAKVAVYEKGFLGDGARLLGYREIEANGGYCGQDSINAEFGLPVGDIFEARMTWPGSGGSNIIQDLLVGKGQFITVHESIFHLESPADGEDVGGFPLTLSWGPAFSGGTKPYSSTVNDYTVQIAKDADFTDIVYTADVDDVNLTLDESSGLVNGPTYYWRVLANYEYTPGSYSQYSAETWTFTLSTVGIGLGYFEGESVRDGVELSWEVSDTGETELAGFNLYRSVVSEGVGIKTVIRSRDRINAELITGESPYEYLDAVVENGVTYNYWLEAVDVSGAAETFGPVGCTWLGVIPTTYALYQSRPNPASGNATIDFDLPETAPVTLTVYDISGRMVRTVVDETLTTGEHEARVSGLAPGVYVYRLKAGEFNAAKKMVIVE